MDGQEVKCPVVMDAMVNSYNEDSLNASNSLNESENHDVDFLDDLDSYWDDIKARLTISRMVSDSVIKGMVNAIEQDAAERIAEKELAVSELKDSLHLHHVGAQDDGLSSSLLVHSQPKNMKRGIYSSFSDVLVEHDRKRESIGSFGNAVKEQLIKLKKDIDRLGKISSTRKINSESKLMGLGLGDPLLEKSSDKWMDLDKACDSLKTTLESMYKEADNLVDMSKVSLCHWQLEREWKVEIEDMVVANCIRSFQEDFEGTLWEQNVRFYGNESVNLVKRIDEISCLCQELDAISKALAAPDADPLTSLGSMENGDHLLRMLSGGHVSTSTTHQVGNGKHEELVIATAENVEAAQLRHLSKDDLVNYFKSEITKMKRGHDYAVQAMTEQYFSLRREFLKEKGSSLPLKKDKAMETLRKKIPDIILKLDEILVENEKAPESTVSLKERVDFLLSENRQLRNLLADRKKEVSQLTGGNSSKIIGNFQCAITNAHIESSIIEDVDQFQDTVHEIYGTLLGGDVQNVATCRNCTYKDTGGGDYDDLDMESIFAQELCGVIFKEAFQEVEQKLGSLNMKYLYENELQDSFEKKAMENEKALKSELAEKERLQQETLLLTASLEKRGELVQETAAALAKEKEQMELASKELINLRDQTSQQNMLISSSCEELNIMKGKLDEALKHSDSNRLEMHELTHGLELTLEELRKVDCERGMFLAATEEKQHMLSLNEAKEREHKKQMESMLALVNMLSKLIADFECRVVHDIEKRNSRVKTLSYQVSSLILKAGILKRTGLKYKQRLGRSCCDLQKAEAEVDLLGDEVEALLGLLEKIYIALDHYSPILQHYPGITEILKLVRRELSSESCKSV